MNAIRMARDSVAQQVNDRLIAQLGAESFDKASGGATIAR
jgi:hypothetical protein